LDINPYAAATPTDYTHHVQPITHPVRFDGLVHRSDVSALGRNDRGARIANIFLVFGYLLITLLVLSVIVLLWNVARSRGVSGAPTIGIIVTLTVFSIPLIALPLWLRWHFQGHVYAKRMLRISPRMIGPLKGAVDNDRIEIEYLHYHSIIPIDSITGIHVTDEVIGLTTDVRKLFLIILPRHLFAVDDFDRVCERLRPLSYTRPLAAEPHLNHDPRLIAGEPMDLMQQPPGSIGFSGTLTFRDLKVSPIYHLQIRKFFAVLISLVIIAAVIVASVLVWIDDKPLAQLLALFISVTFGFAVFRRLYAYLSIRKYHDQPIANLTGWVNQDCVTINSPIGSAAYRKSAFIRVDSSDHAIYGALGGQFPQVVIMPSRMFKQHDDFLLARSHVLAMKAM